MEIQGQGYIVPESVRLSSGGPAKFSQLSSVPIDCRGASAASVQGEQVMAYRNRDDVWVALVFLVAVLLVVGAIVTH